MMRLPAFELRTPATGAEVASILAGEGARAMVVAGGTDLYPNMKRRQQVPEVVVSLRRLGDLRRIEPDGARGLRLGATARLDEIAGHGGLREGWTALARAAAQVATPHLRNMATLGGNVCLDTRCSYYDQNFEWRQAIGFCMKKDGTTCWVATSSPKCLAVSSTDCAPALIALDAEATLLSREGQRRVRVADLYRNDGQFYLEKRPDELLTDLHVPDRAGWRSTYWKLRRRGSIDFPVLGCAVALRMSGDVVEDARIVLGAVSSRPLVAADAAGALLGGPLTDEAIDRAAAEAARLAKPMDNTDFTLHWRKSVVRPYVAGALKQLRGDDPASLTLLQRRAALSA